MELVIGTKNPAKLDQMASVLEPLGIFVLALPADIPEAEEAGETPQENAVAKALAYSLSIGQPVLSLDNALFFDGLSLESQPGVHVRRLPGHSGRPSDQEALEYYAALVRSLGGRINGYFEYGFCLAHPDGRQKSISLKSPRIFVSQPSPKVIAGYPLESIQIDPQSGKYISEMTPDEQAEFWRRTIGREVGELVFASGILD